MRTLVLVLILCLSLSARTAAADPVPAGQHQAHLTGSGTLGSEMGVVEGAPPSSAHPRGTVIIAWSLQQHGPTLTEWDLARQRVVRQVSLGWGESNVRVARAGDVLHVLVAHDDGMVGYARVDAITLRIACRAELGRGTALDIAADATTAAAAWVDMDTSRVHGIPRLQLAMLGSTCAVTRSAASVETGWAGAIRHKQVAVLGGRAFVAIGNDSSWRVLAFSPSAALEGQLSLPSSDRNVSLLAASGRLLLGVRSEIMELSPGLSVTARHPCFCGASIFMAAAPDGRLLTSHGTVLSTGFTEGKELSPATMWVHDVTWVGDTPVALSTALEPSSWAWIDWLEPGR